MSICNTVILSAAYKVFCAPLCSNNGGDDSKLFLPTSFPQLQRYSRDLQWVNGTLRHQGILVGKLACTKMIVKPFNDAGGFYSELALIEYEYDDMHAAEENGLPMEGIAKFLPQQPEKRIQLAAFKLGCTEVYAYAVSNALAPVCGRSPYILTQPHTYASPQCTTLRIPPPRRSS